MSPSTVNLAICLSVPILTGPLLYRVLPLLEFYHLSVKFDFLLVLVKNTFLPRIEKVKVFCLERTSKILFILVYIVPEPCDVRVWRFKRSRIGCLQNVWIIQVDVWCARHEKGGWKRPETSTARQKLTTCVGGMLRNSAWTKGIMTTRNRQQVGRRNEVNVSNQVSFDWLKEWLLLLLRLIAELFRWMWHRYLNLPRTIS